LFFILSKLLHFLTAPLTWVLFLLLLVLFTKKQRKRKLRLIVAIIVFLVFSNTALYRSIIPLYKTPGTRLHADSSYTAAIVLGGIASYNRKAEQTVFNKAADRLMQTLHLYHTGVIDKIIISGGSGYVFFPEAKEAHIIEQYLLDNQIPKSDILTESKSRNTYENARFTSDLIRQKKLKGSFLLISSSLHLPRARMCFEKQGVNPDVYPAENYDGIPLSPSDYIVPDAATLKAWEMFFHELLGLLAYRLAGYI
jgi:uncharacterized SAM-binding protein YcdF (DUF218 family)